MEPTVGRCACLAEQGTPRSVLGAVNQSKSHQLGAREGEGRPLSPSALPWQPCQDPPVEAEKGSGGPRPRVRMGLQPAYIFTHVQGLLGLPRASGLTAVPTGRKPEPGRAGMPSACGLGASLATTLTVTDGSIHPACSCFPGAAACLFP